MPLKHPLLAAYTLVVGTVLLFSPASGGVVTGLFVIALASAAVVVR